MTWFLFSRFSHGNGTVYILTNSLCLVMSENLSPLCANCSNYAFLTAFIQLRCGAIYEFNREQIYDFFFLHFCITITFNRFFHSPVRALVHSTFAPSLIYNNHTQTSLLCPSIPLKTRRKKLPRNTMDSNVSKTQLYIAIGTE